MKKTIGFVGLGKMGGNHALQAVEKGYEVVSEVPSYNIEDTGEVNWLINDAMHMEVRCLSSPRQ
jgi:6-phosphogluconate dehydrogenase (decarboxylating)